MAHLCILPAQLEDGVSRELRLDHDVSHRLPLAEKPEGFRVGLAVAEVGRAPSSGPLELFPLRLEAAPQHLDGRRIEPHFAEEIARVRELAGVRELANAGQRHPQPPRGDRG